MSDNQTPRIQPGSETAQPKPADAKTLHETLSKVQFYIYHLLAFVALLAVGIALTVENSKLKAETELPIISEAETSLQRNEDLVLTLDSISDNSRSFTERNYALQSAVDSFIGRTDLLPANVLPEESKYYFAKFTNGYPHPRLLIFLPRYDLKLEVEIETVFNGTTDSRVEQTVPSRSGWLILEYVTADNSERPVLSWSDPLDADREQESLEVTTEGQPVGQEIADDPNYNLRDYSGLIPFNTDDDPFRVAGSSSQKYHDRLGENSRFLLPENPVNSEAPVLMRIGNSLLDEEESVAGRVNVIVKMVVLE